MMNFGQLTVEVHAVVNGFHFVQVQVSVAVDVKFGEKSSGHERQSWFLHVEIHLVLADLDHPVLCTEQQSESCLNKNVVFVLFVYSTMRTRT